LHDSPNLVAVATAAIRTLDMASASFRDSMNSLGWSRREPEPVNTSSPSLLGRLQNLNPFGEGGYVRLPITETNPGAPLPAPTRREEEEGWFARK
jgi:hypothetical protein